MENLHVMQENELTVTKSMHPFTMQLLYAHANKLITGDVQICFSAQYLNLHAKYSNMLNMPGSELVPISPIAQLQRIKNFVQ